MARLSIELKLDRVLPLFSSLTKNEIKKVMRRAHRRTVAKANTEVYRVARERVLVKRQGIKSATVIQNFNDSEGLPFTRMGFRRSRIPLSQFAVREDNAGITAKVYTKQGRTRVKSAFMPKKSKRVFIRKEAVQGDAKKLAGKPFAWQDKQSRRVQYISELMTLGLSGMITPKADQIVADAGATGRAELERQVKLLLGT
jgi:hypothetical protein